VVRHYGAKRTQVGELSLPAGAGPHPVAVLLHGGFWHAMYGRRLMSNLAADLAANGVAAWNLDYRGIGGGGGWPATFDDVAAGIDALAAVPGLDLNRVTTVGHSAGGQLALWAAARPGLPVGTPGSAPPVAVAAAVSLAGVVDLVDADRRGIGGGAVAQLLGGRSEQVAERYRLASPIERLPLGVPQLLVHGVRDRHVPADMSERYAEAAQAAGDPVDLAVRHDVGHMDLMEPRSPGWSVALDWLLRI
jgi:dipeptidyl aminopeptidase/acylaminoacyl peptidase